MFLLVRLVCNIVVAVAGKVAERVFDVCEVQLSDVGAVSVELCSYDFVFTAYSGKFEAGAVVFVFGEPFGVPLHDVVEYSEGFGCWGVDSFHVVVGVVVAGPFVRPPMVFKDGNEFLPRLRLLG